MLICFVFVHGMLNNNMVCLIPFKLDQQCMKQLGGLYIYVCIHYQHKKSENSSYQMDSYDCILVQTGTFCEK